MPLYIVGLGIILASYLIGSISTAVLVSKLFGLSDPRTVGSNNPGTTNILRIGGKLPAVLTLLGDGLKGFIPVYATKLYLSNLPSLEMQWIISAVFLSVVLGHLYPIFFRFKGGKGVATALGGLFALHWILGLSFVGIWIVIAGITRYSALSALVAIAIMPVIELAIGLGYMGYTLVILFVAILIFWRHRVNIQNLIKGTESKIGGRR